MTAKNVLLLGCGMQGKAALHDLMRNAGVGRIVVADSDPGLEASLAPHAARGVVARGLDVCDVAEVSRLMQEADVVVEALPGRLGRPMGRLALQAGVSLVTSMYYVDPGAEDTATRAAQREEVALMDRAARGRGLTILTEFGLDPGIDLVLAARVLSELDDLEELHSYGAGIPDGAARQNPLAYKFSWSPIGVLRAYHRPARLISRGQVRQVGAREMFAPDNVHMLDVEELGEALECFPNGDAVHYAELFGIEGSVREMGRYAARWPGHCAFWRVMASCGFLEETPLRVGHVSVPPIELVAALLDSQAQFHYAEDERDLTLLRVDGRGRVGGTKRRIVYQLLDHRDPDTGFTSMQRTVGFTLAHGARLILEGRLEKKGLVSPLDVPYPLLIEGLRPHGIEISRQELPWE